MKIYLILPLFLLNFHALCFGESAALKLAESDPEAFQVMLEKQVLKDLLKERYQKNLSSIQKYEKFISAIKNKTSRSKSQEFLLDMRANYKTSWHLKYPILLSPRWHEIKGNPKTKSDFAEILRLNGVSNLNSKQEVEQAMEVKSGVQLFATIDFLDPLELAISKLGDGEEPLVRFKSRGTRTRNAMESAGFPLNTFYYYILDVEHRADEMNRIMFMVDSYDRVIGVQVVIESPKSIRLRGHSNSRSVFNFLQMRRKGSPAYQIAYGTLPKLAESAGSPTTKMPAVELTYVGLESELLDGKGKPREWAKLYLPISIARVCMFCSVSIKD